MGLQRGLSFFMAVSIVVFFRTVKVDAVEAAPDFSEAPVVSVSLFKNGLAMITRELAIPSSSRKAVIVADPVPIHGTFWVDFENPVRVENAQVVWKEKRIVRNDKFDIRKALEAMAGKKVTLVLSGGDRLNGVIVCFPNLETHFLILRTEKGCEFLDAGQVIRAAFEDKNLQLVPVEMVKEGEVKKNILTFSYPESGHSRILRFSYLCRGASWAPAYRFDLTEEGKGVLSFQGVVKNEVLPFRKTLVNLVSGFPAILYDKVLSPMNRSQKLDAFLSSLSRPDRAGSSPVTQQIALNIANDWDEDSPSSGLNTDLDSDMHLRSVGPVDLEEGDALMLDLGKTATTFERVVEWNIPESRDLNGRYQRNWRRRETGGTSDELWDTLIVSNPFDFPMTTAPFTVYRDGQILSQNISNWTARGRKSRVRSGRVLNIGTEVSEEEVEGSRKRIVIRGDDFMQTDIRCVITLDNRRGTGQTVMVNRSIWGKIIESSGKAVTRKLAEGAQSVNPRSEVEWRLELAPGQKMKIGFTYTVLTDI